jgi:hypothetical protein
MADQGWADIRHQYGDVYITVFPDGLTVPWKTLSLGDYIYYDQQIARHVIPPACLENEVFCRCVQDRELVDGIDHLVAGIVTTVVHNIWEYSGPDTPERLQQDFDTARSNLQGGRGAVLHQCAFMIATAFNYTLEQVYAMDYATFMFRLAQAEAKMLTMNIIKEPLTLNINQPPQVANLNQTTKPRVKLNAKEVWEKQQSLRLSKPTPSEPKGKWWKVSPVLESDQKKKINFTAEKANIDQTILDTHENLEKGAMRQYIIDKKLSGKRAKLVEDARIIYKDLITELEKSKK